MLWGLGFATFCAIAPVPMPSTDERGFLPQDAPVPDVSMQPYERKQLLERIGREGATVGAAIPEEITVQDEPIDLRAFVFEIKRRETIPQGQRERVDQAKRNLRRERLERVERIEEGDIDRAEGERLVETVIGIDRALNALESLGPTDLEREERAQQTADKKRWMRFLQQALGNEDDAAARRGR